MNKYRKKPVVIEAVLWNGKNLLEVTRFMSGYFELERAIDRERFDDYISIVENDGLKINTLEGVMNANIGDYIIKGIQGEFYPCKPDIFEATYEIVKDDE